MHVQHTNIREPLTAWVRVEWLDERRDDYTQQFIFAFKLHPKSN